MEAEKNSKGVAVPGLQLNRTLFVIIFANQLVGFVLPVMYGLNLSALANLPRFSETVNFPV